MIKIMIVDDEPVFRDYLKNFIDWKTYGFTVCGEAKDGREALQCYEEYQPDIVLADIMMPYMDGLELSEALFKENPDISIILISGNSEFEYARRAVKLGVCDYIVKPFEKEELIVSLLKLQDNINKVLEMRNEQDELREHQLRQFIYTKDSQHLPGSYLFTMPYFLVVTTRIELHENKVAPEEIVKWKQILSSLLKNKIQIEGEAYIFHDFEGNIVTILNFKERQDMERYDGFEFEDISKLTMEHIGFEITVGISDYCEEAEQLSEAYYQTIQAISRFYADHHSKIFDYKKVLQDGGQQFYSWSLIDEINRALEVLDYKRIEKNIAKELDDIKEYENPEYAMMVYMSLLSVLLSYIVKMGRSIDDVFGQNFRPYSLVRGESSYIEKRNFICQCYQRAIEYQQDHQDTKSSQIAEQAKQYIEENFSNPSLMIGDISRKLLVNQTYLRKMFKDTYQTTISDYITRCRMERAKQLILSENSKLSYVSQRVGYNDTSYFSKCFKKYFGYLPSDMVGRQ